MSSFSHAPLTLTAKVGLGLAAVLFLSSVSCSGGEIADPYGPAPGESSITARANAETSTTTAPRSLTAKTTTWKLDKAWARAVALADGNQLLVYSGLDANLRSLNRVTHIDPTTGKVTELGKTPHIVHDAAGAWLGDTALLIGGGEQDAGSDEIVAVTGGRAGKIIGHLPESRSDVSAVTVGNRVFVLGGYDGKNLPAGILATTDGSSFTRVADLAPAVRYGAPAAAGTKIYIFGGKLAKGQTDAIQEIETTSGAVKTVGHFPKPLGHAFAFTIGGTIYVAGGRLGTGDTTATTPASDEIWRFDPTNGQVTSAGRLPYAVADGGVAVIDNRAYLVGGENNAGTPLNTVIELTQT